MTDGFDHINIYSQGETELGRALSNFSDHGIITLDGEFASVEGYWYWLSCTGPRRDELRFAVGWEAKKLGRELRGQDWVRGDDFKLRIIGAMVSKLILHPSLATKLRESVLPFRHYYVYGGRQVTPSDGQWIIDTWEHLRRVLRG
jgi:hypothetical protein